MKKKVKRKQKNLKFFFSEISAKKEENIKNVFEKLMKKILEDDKKDILKKIKIMKIKNVINVVPV